MPPKPIPLSHPNPRILIIGAGVGGIALANLCEAAGFDYLVLEKASEFRPLGSAISLNHDVFPFLDQLGIYDDLRKVGLPNHFITIHSMNVETGKIKRDGSMPPDYRLIEKYGYPYLMFSRPDLMEILLKKIPKSKILMQKKVKTVQQNKDGVVVHIADGTSYHGHILVGADGCYSPVRESMYAEIEKHRPLPVSDKAPLKYDIDCIVGVTSPLDPIEFPEMTKDVCEFQILLPTKEKVSIWMMPLSRNRLGWMVNEVMSDEKKSAITNGFKKPKEDTNNNNTTNTTTTATSTTNAALSEWGSDSAEKFCERFKDYPTTYGNNVPLKTFFDKTPKELISKVMLEEKFFETWQDGRTCLIGDACHKVLPFGAVGAINAMLDAVQLANLLYDLKSNSYESIRKVLIEYERLRKERGRTAVKGSALGGKLFHAKGWTGNLARQIILHCIPNFLMDRARDKAAKYRIQCGFLPFKGLGAVKHDKQDYCVRYLMEKEQADGAKKFDEEVLVGVDGPVPVEGAVAA